MKLACLSRSDERQRIAAVAGARRRPAWLAASAGIAAPLVLALVATLVAGCGSVSGPIATPASCSSAGSPNKGPFDISITSILVTQAIQTTAPLNTVPLVAQRSTAVRVMLGNTGDGYVSGVTGTLSVLVDGTAISLGSHSPSINPSFVAPAVPAWANECDTLNFEIPAPTGITASGNVRFVVEVAPVAKEKDTTNNSGEVTLSFANRTTPLLYYTRINFADQGLPDTAFVKAGTGDSFVRGIYPVNDADSALYRQGLFPTLPWADPNGNGVLDGAEVDSLLSQLAQCRQLIVNSGAGPDDRVFLYGWIKDNPIDGNGWASVGGRVAFGNTEASRGQRTFAHELGHNFGFNHNGATLGETGWHVAGRLANNPAGNNVAPDGRIKPASLYDIMTPAKLTNQAWITPSQYRALYQSPTLATSPDARTPDKEVAVIQGIFDPTGNELLALNPVFRYPWPSLPTPVLQELNRYLAEITTTNGEVVRVPFDALTDSPKGEEGELRRGFFEVQAKVSGDIALLKIIDTERDKTVAERAPAKPPTIRLTGPASGTELGATTTISWEAQYGVATDQVRYQIAYSPDNGQTFVPLAVGVPGDTRKITVDTREIQRSAKTGLIRVFLSDGLNTTYADATDLTTTAAIY